MDNYSKGLFPEGFKNEPSLYVRAVEIAVQHDSQIKQVFTKALTKVCSLALNLLLPYQTASKQSYELKLYICRGPLLPHHICCVF